MNDDDDDDDYRVAHSEGSSIGGRCSHSPPWPLSVWRHSSFGSVVSHTFCLSLNLSLYLNLSEYRFSLLVVLSIIILFLGLRFFNYDFVAVDFVSDNEPDDRLDFHNERGGNVYMNYD